MCFAFQFLQHKLSACWWTTSDYKTPNNPDTFHAAAAASCQRSNTQFESILHLPIVTVHTIYNSILNL